MSDDTNRTTANDTANISLGRSSLIGAGGKFVLALIGFAGVVYFYRDLGPTKIGIYYSILAGVKIATQFQNSVSTAIMKRVSEVNADQSGYLGIGVLSWLGFTTVGGVCIFIGTPFIDRYGLTIAHLVGGLVMMSTLGLFATINQFYTGIGNPGKGIWTDAVRSVLTLFGQATLLLIGFGEFGLMWGFAFGNLATAVGLFVVIGVFPARPSRTVITRTISFAKWSLPNGLVNMVYSRLDVVVLGFFIGSTSVGYYQPALQMTMPAVFVAASISQSISIKSSGLDSQGSSVIGDLRNGIAYAGLISIPLFFGALAIPRELMRTIFGPSAVAGAGALVGLALFQIFRSYIKPMGSVFQGVDRPDLNVKITLIALLINIPLAIVLVMWYGLVGVVVATVVAELLLLALNFVIMIQLFGNPGVPREALEQLFAAVVMFGVIEGLTTLGGVQITTVIELLLVVGSGAGVYFVVLVGISNRFKNTARTIIRETIPQAFRPF